VLPVAVLELRRATSPCLRGSGPAQQHGWGLKGECGTLATSSPPPLLPLPIVCAAIKIDALPLTVLQSLLPHAYKTSVWKGRFKQQASDVTQINASLNVDRWPDKQCDAVIHQTDRHTHVLEVAPAV
jgi:hypothetical protein